MLYLVLLLFAGSGLSRGSDDPVRIGIGAYPENLHPSYATDETSQMVVNKVYQALFDFSPDGGIRNCLVQRTFIHSPREITLVLKKNIIFSSGRQLTADDTIATFHILRDSRYRYPYRSVLEFLSTMKKIDPHRIALKLKHPYALWKHHLTFKILPADEILSLSPEEFRKHLPSGTNAYRYRDLQPPEGVLLTPNPHYPRKDLPPLAFRVFTYPHLAPAKLLTGELDICGFPAEQAARYGRKKPWQRQFLLHRYWKVGFHFLVFNLRTSGIPLNTRQAIFNLVHTTGFLDQFLGDTGRVFHTPFHPLNDQIPLQSLPAGPIESADFTVITNSESPRKKRFLLFLSRALEKKGLRVTPEFYEYHTFLKRVKGGNYQAALCGFLLESDPDMRDIFHSESPFNYAGFQNPEMDRLMEKGLEIPDYKERIPLYLKAHGLWQKHLPLIPLYQPYYYLGIRRGINTPNPPIRVVASESDCLYNIADWLNLLDQSIPPE